MHLDFLVEVKDMKFSEFAHILFRFHGGKKWEYCRELLKAGLSAEGCDYIKSIPHDRSGKDRFIKYLNGTNNITNIAPHIINYFEDNLFVDYIYDMYSECFTEICQAFKESGFNIEADDVPASLTEIFHDILNTASVEVKKGKSSTSNKEKIPSRHKAKIEDIADKIRYFTRNLFYGYEGQENLPSFQVNYCEYQSLCQQLIEFRKLYPFIKSLKEIDSMMLKDTEFYLLNTDGMKKRSSFEKIVEDIYNELLLYPDE